MNMQHIRYKPRINLGSLGVTRESIDYNGGTRSGLLTPTRYYVPPPTLLQPLQPPPVIQVPISPPASFYEPSPTLTPPPGTMWTAIQPPVGTVWSYPTDPTTGLTTRVPVTAPGSEPFAPTFDTTIPESFRYSKEQLMDMLARGASETYERTGETDSGLPIEMELEQISRELDATKQYAVDADGTIIPVEPKGAPGAGLGWLAAAAAAFLILGG